MSLRQLAKKIELDPSALSLTFRGKRKMTLEEANQIANLLGVQVTEILRQAGVPVSEDVQGVRLIGTVDSRSVVKPLAGAVKRIHAPADVPIEGYALQVRAANVVGDGWLLFVSGDKSPPELMLDRLCVATLKGGTRIVGSLRRGYDADLFNLLPFLDMTGTNTLENQAVESASSILWTRPQ